MGDSECCGDDGDVGVDGVLGAVVDGAGFQIRFLHASESDSVSLKYAVRRSRWWSVCVIFVDSGTEIHQAISFFHPLTYP